MAIVATLIQQPDGWWIEIYPRAWLAKYGRLPNAAEAAWQALRS